jgi:uncharacterized protein YgbK (DUF1537 family)
MARGFGSVAIDVLPLLERKSASAESDRVLGLALAELEAGRSVILHTALGPRDARLLGMADPSKRQFQERIGLFLGHLLQEILLHSNVKRAVICGGDTSARAGSQLGIFAVTTLKPLAPGSPLCLTWSDDPTFDGLEIVFKGGQVGDEDFFGLVLRGG